MQTGDKVFVIVRNKIVEATVAHIEGWSKRMRTNLSSKYLRSEDYGSTAVELKQKTIDKLTKRRAALEKQLADNAKKLEKANKLLFFKNIAVGGGRLLITD